MISTSDGDVYDSGYDFESSFYSGPGSTDYAFNMGSGFSNTDFGSSKTADDTGIVVNTDKKTKDQNEIEITDPKGNLIQYTGPSVVDATYKGRGTLGPSLDYMLQNNQDRASTAEPASLQKDPVPLPTPRPDTESNFNQDVFNQKFQGPLAGKADVVEQKAKEYGVPAALAAGIMAQETGYGKSVAVTKYNNPAGMMHGNQPMTFKSIDEGIDHAVRNIAHQYNNAGQSLERLQKIYAPVGAANDPSGLNKDWLPGVSKLLKLFAR